ncbi:MAG TPA: calcium/proton exchanger, partial [Chloroflexota bacterium]|nr:calcium/proton exchanger [Chloroflexota bacterium]
MARNRRDMPPSVVQGRVGMVAELVGFLGESWINWLLVLVPVSWAVELLDVPRLWVFLFSALAIIPLAHLIGHGTEQVAGWIGHGPGGLLNAAMGNATELIISLFALKAGLITVVKAAISGSLIGNTLLVLGMSMLVGGWGRDKQTFNRTRAGATASMLFLAVVALVMPAVFDLEVFGTLRHPAASVDSLSLLVCVVLILTYMASLVFSLKTHREVIPTVHTECDQPRLSLVNSVTLLLAATVLVAVESELLVGGISDATAALGMTEFFVGIVVVAVVGNAAEYFTAMMMAKRNRMELSVTIATGAGTQVAL